MSKESSFQKLPFQTIGFSSHLQLARARNSRGNKKTASIDARLSWK